MRPERNPLDLNNFPEDYTRDGKQAIEDTSLSAGHGKKKSGAKEGKDECGKFYECRFCSLKFCKSQALGGHMNRHRQERETETLNRARQLVFSNDTAQAAHHLGGPPTPHGGYHQAGVDPALPFRPVYPKRLFSGSSSTILPPPPPHQPYLYPSPPRLVSYPSQYPPPHSHHQVNEYFLGHVLSGPPDTNYACIGAPVGHTYPHGGQGPNMGTSSGGGGGDGDISMQHLDPSSINRFQYGF
ncbi:zinc finger protein JAGGED-like [Actinidia eriantha]|uniref:zinc finger protein JAGGED-like n=1 Tax=Actinidia eriantha TaxID=165200 RepID=UPI00258F66C2|nr:zinc finger protein JAGGED-like [Actinidia eriantha]